MIVKATLVGGIVAGSGLALRGLWARGWRLRERDEHQLRAAFGTAVVALLVASLLRDVVSLPVLAVTAGLTGWATVQVCQRARVADAITRRCGGVYKARAAAWFVISVLALASYHGLLTFRAATALFALGMALWNSRRDALSQ